MTENSRPRSTLGDICSEVRYGYTASATATPTPTRFLRVTDIAGDTLEWTSVPYCQIGEPELEKYRLLPGDIVIARMGTIGASALIGDSPRAVFASYLIRFRVKRNVALPEYVAYTLRSPSFHRFLHGFGGGSVQPNINAQTLKRFPIYLPTLDEQQSIASVLSSLDDKIQLNRRMNETLEEIARTLFRSWFFDFDPVRANAEGREPYGVVPGILTLFPSTLQDSQVGAIPSGWTVDGLDSIAAYTNGLALQKYPPESDHFLPVIKIAQMRTQSTQGSGKASALLDPRFIVEDGDVLFSWSGSLEVVLWTGGRGALNQHLFKVTSDRYPKWFYYFWTRHHLATFRAIAAGKATTMGHIQRHHLTQAQVVVPPPELLDAADKVLAPLLDLIIANSVQARTLAETRDALLPRLLSGEIHVREPEQVLESSV